jgi:parvulin-like peptidyl-prolyl isomerase
VIFAVLVLGYAAFATFIQKPNEELAKVGNVSINRATYEKARRYNLFQQARTSLFFEQQGAGSSSGLASSSTLLAQIQTVDKDPIDAATVDQMVDDQVTIQKAASDLQVTASKDEIKESAVKEFLPSPTPPTTPEPSATVEVSGTATITPTNTLTPTPGSPTATPTKTATLPPVPGASATAIASYQSAVDQITTGANITEQDYLDLIVAPQAVKEKVTDLLAKDVPTTTEAIHAQHILTDTEEGANKILLMLKEGQDFTKVANAQSSEQITREVQGATPNGGDLGWFDKDGNVLADTNGSTLVKEFTDAAWTVEPGQYSQAPVKTQFGYHIIKVLEKNPRYELSDTQIQAKKDQTYTDWFNKVKADMQSEIKYSSLVPRSAPVPTQPAILPPTVPPSDATPSDSTGPSDSTPGSTPPSGTTPEATLPAASTPPTGSEPPTSTTTGPQP